MVVVSSRPVLRGRSEELSAVLRAIQRAKRTGAAEMVVVTGEPGIGKSALLRSAVEQGARAGAAVGLGRAEETGSVISGEPLLLALRSGPRPLIDGAAFAGLETLYDRQLWLIERISDLLEAAAAKQPVVLAIDNVHRADALTRLALRILPARLAASPVVWVLTSRVSPADVADETVLTAADALNVTRVRLDRLTDDEIADLACDRLGEPADEATRELLRGAGGSPFWAVQLLGALAWRRANGVPHEDMHAELIDDVRLRLAPLEDETKALVRYAAVWGRGLPIAAAARLLGDLPAARVIRAAREAADNGLLHQGESGLEFGHALVREALYADITTAERDELHRGCARYLLGEGASVAAAGHFRAYANSGDLEAAAALLNAAEESAAAMPDRAAELAQAAFALVPEADEQWLPTGRRVLDLLTRVQRERSVVEIADRLLAGTADPAAVAALQVQACQALYEIGEYDEIDARTARLLRMKHVPAAVRAQLAAIRAHAAVRTGSRSTAEAEHALAEGRRLGDENAQRLALLALAEAARNEGRHRVALGRFADLRRLSSTADHFFVELRALQHLDRYDEAAAMLAEARRDEQALPSYLLGQLWQDHDLARFDDAEAGGRTLLRLAREIGHAEHEVSARSLLSAVSIYRGDLAGARELVSAPADGDNRGAVWHSRYVMTRAWMTVEEGDFAASHALLKPILMAAASGGAHWAWTPPWMRTFAGLGLTCGDAEFTGTAVRLAEMAAERNPGVATIEGIALQTRGLVESDVELLGRGVEALRRGPRPLLLAQALADHAQVLRGKGDVLAADQRAAEACALLEMLGGAPGSLSGLLVTRDAATPRRRPGGRAVTGLGALTDTERRVADLTAAGHSSRSAAQELGVSPNTVNTHLRAVFAKLDVRSRVQLSNLINVR